LKGKEFRKARKAIVEKWRKLYLEKGVLPFFPSSLFGFKDALSFSSFVRALPSDKKYKKRGRREDEEEGGRKIESTSSVVGELGDFLWCN